MNKEQLEKEWQELIDEYGLDELRRWFVSFRGYVANRSNKDYEEIKKTLKDLVIKS